MRALTVISFAIVMVSCSPTSKIVKYKKVPDEVYANNNLKTFLKQNKSPKIVLRVPNSNDKATSNTSTSKDNNLLYNSIEKVFLREGFSVRDRGLFNEIINKSGTTDYSKIQDLTDTDLILEVVNIDPTVVYSTNKVLEIKGRRETEYNYETDFKKYGAAIEFRFIMVKTNEIAGSYKYNYQPCPDGCEVNTFRMIGKRNPQVELKETVSVNALEEFIKKCTQDLINSFRSNS